MLTDEIRSFQIKVIFPIYFDCYYHLPEGINIILPKWARDKIYQIIRDNLRGSIEYVETDKGRLNSSILRLITYTGIKEEEYSTSIIVDISEFQVGNNKLDKFILTFNKETEYPLKTIKSDLLKRLKIEASRRSCSLNDLILTAMNNELRKTYDLNRSLEIDPDDQRELYLRAQKYSNMGHHDLSMSDCNRLIDLKHDRAYLLRAAIHSKIGDIQQAKKDIRTFLKKNPNDHFAHYMLGKTYLKEGKKKHGFKELQLAQELGSDEAKVLLSKQTEVE